MSDVVSKAAHYAKAAHVSIDQRRKYTNEPYIVHPQAVARIVASVTDDQSTIAAAWLHDVAEDTSVTIEQISDAFRSDIAGLVADLTAPSIEADGNRSERKAIDRQHTAKADPRAKTVKLADLIDNLSTIVASDPVFAEMYLNEKELQLQVLTEGNHKLFRRAQRVICDAKQTLANCQRESCRIRAR